ncbi:hypothetical protein [Pygmaiobacter massiliensis]|uniref:hypothetical protein n=1 Tax=Pygmaiobacter massiliensis TaxID=1917873 RepID=UPI002A803BB1|nr:hypothetical protein [Pygmaiobacter massiliensis]MDY4785542.1 hypothetical protein [Pygmaiobacter massiliensis]
MRFKKALSALAALVLAVSLPVIQPHAAGPSLSADQQWIEGVTTGMEYITEVTYNEQGGAAANSRYWTSLSGGTRPDGTKYSPFGLVEGSKLPVASAWYGKNVCFRVKGTSGSGTVIQIPEYSQLKESYKKSVRVFNAYSPDTGQSFYANYIDSVTDSNGYLLGISDKVNITVTRAQIQSFNKVPDSYLTDAEGNYIYDLVAIGGYTLAEPDLSGAAAWALKRYIQEGYGFLIGHDTMYGYGGVNPDPNYRPDPNSTTTPMYELNTNNGHWNMNWLMGVNKLYTEASPYEAASLILNIGDWKDKSTLYGDHGKEKTISSLRVKAITPGNPLTNVDARCPTNYPYSTYHDGAKYAVGDILAAGATHTNQQIAYGKVWLDFASNSTGGKLVTDRNAGLTGTNNFYLTTNGNFGLMQIGHSKDNLISASPDECRILANTILYLSQREPCAVCQSRQGGNKTVHAVTRISSAEELAKIGNPAYWYTYPLTGCYVLLNDVTLPEDWKPIENFRGHFDAAGHKVITNGKSLFQQSGVLGLNPGGWNLGTSPDRGFHLISGALGITTGTARVEGHLGQLFGTDSSVEYGGYTVKITGSDGKTYDCTVNREGKYVVSNLPCTGVKMAAQVFDAAGQEVTEYGSIYAKVAPTAWDANETVPLRLESDTVRPVPNQTVYEDSDAVFVGGINSSVMPQRITWQYRAGAGDNWRNVSDTLDFSAAVAPPEIIDAASPYVETRMTIKDAQIPLDKMQFRVVFVLDGNTYNSFDAKTAKAAGLLRVLERPYKLEPIQDVSGWEGDTVDLVANFTYYRKLHGSEKCGYYHGAPLYFSPDCQMPDEVEVRWQFRGGPDCTWENVEGSPLIGSHKAWVSYSEYMGQPTNALGYESTAYLRLENLSTDVTGYEFRAVLEYKKKNRRFETDKVAVPGATGKVTVSPKLLQCSVQPKNSPLLEVSGDVIPGQHKYTAEFIYTAPDAFSGIHLSWEFKTNAKDTYKPIYKFPYANVQSVEVYPASTIAKNTYVIKTQLTLTNPPTALDLGSNHYYFRAKATTNVATVYSNSADITITYKVDIQPGKPIAHVSADGKTKIYTYPNLQVYAPEGVRNMEVAFAADSRQDGNRVLSAAGLADTVEIPGQKGFVYNSYTGLTARAARDFLRQVQFVVSTSTANLQWSVASDRAAGDIDPYSGNYYEYVPSAGITWTQSYNAARGRYNTALQAQGRLATVRSDSANNLVHRLVGNQYAWIGMTSDSGYAFGRPGWWWIDGGGIGYQLMQDWLYPYVQMRPDGLWRTALNNQSAAVTLTDMIEFNGSNLGGWVIAQGRLFGHTPESDNNNQGYTGLLLLAPGSAGTDTVARHNVYLQSGHAYWIYGMTGEFGDSNGNMVLSTPFGHRIESYWNIGPAHLNTIARWTGGTGWQSMVTQTNGNGPDRGSGVGGQLYHLEVVDLTESFEARGLSLPTEQWLRDNIGVFNGSRSVSFTSNSSNANGFVVEYVVDDNRPMHTARSARAKDTLRGVQPGDIPTDTVKEAEYRTDTDVLISCGVSALSAINPSSPASVTFRVTAPDGRVSTHTYADVCLPAGATQRAYIKYRVLTTPGALRVDITTSPNLIADTVTINAKVVELKENTPPDPKATDRNDSFVVPVTPTFANVTQHEWISYTCENVGGDWVYTEHEHHETLRAGLNVQPDARVPTAEGKNMKSGYGITMSVTAGGAKNTDVLMPQTVVGYFPESRYKDYWRLLERTSPDSSPTASFELKENPWSQTTARVHFTPLWYPDKPYKVFVTVRDMWTPVGELKQAVSDTITIQGSVHDDWYVAKGE